VALVGLRPPAPREGINDDMARDGQDETLEPAVLDVLSGLETLEDLLEDLRLKIVLIEVRPHARVCLARGADAAAEEVLHDLGDGLEQLIADALVAFGKA